MAEALTRPTPATTLAPRLSVVVPVHDAAGTLERCLAALCASTLPRAQWELIVVDDASSDGSATLAARHADAIVRLPGRSRGPAYARNRGVEACRGEVVVFVAPTVAVAPQSLERLLAAFDADPELGAASGCWDPGVATRPGLTAWYLGIRGLFDQRADAPPAFCADLGAVRASVLCEVGPFDEWLYPTASVEDAELGHRLQLAGRRVVRVPGARAVPLAPARLRTVLVDDVRSRVVPGTRLALHVGGHARGPRRQRALIGAGCALLALVALAAWPFDPGGAGLQVAAIASLAGLVADADLLRFAASVRGRMATAALLPLHFAATAARAIGAILGWVAHHMVGPPRVPIEIYARNCDGDGQTPIWPPRPVQPSLSVWTRPPHGARRRTRRVAA